MRSADGGTRRNELSRRGFLRAGALVAVVAPVAACTGTPAVSAPDPLQPLLTAAARDAATAKQAASAFADNGATLAVIASVRQEQASALRTEVNRAAGVTSAPAPPSGSAVKAPALGAESTVTAQLTQSLVTAQHQAAALMASLPRYRAGLVGSVAAGCASLREALDSAPITVTSATSPSASTSPSESPVSSVPDTAGVPVTGSIAGTATGPLATDTASALQDALSAENAALWLYGTASAFVGGGVEPEIVAAMNAVQNLRDAAAQRLSAGQVTPQPAQPAYLVPTPVSDQSTALAALAKAESSATVAWRSVLEHTDDKDLRAAALEALVDSAVRETRWRRLSGQSPASIAMPGTAT